MHRTRILLLFGGESAEHDVSVASARNVFAALDDRKYDIMLCYITKDGVWRLLEDIKSLDGPHKTLLPVLGERHFIAQPGGHSIVPEVILPILHGPHGEDGTVQGLASLLHIPIAGCGVLASAMCMDKEISKRLLQAAGLNVAECVVHYSYQDYPDFSQLSLQLGNPLFVKPACLGSSVGVYKVYTEADFKKALQQAHTYDTKVIIEQAIAGRELACGVLGTTNPQATGVAQIKPAADFYTYEAKYNANSQTEYAIPADISQQVTSNVQGAALLAYKTLECQGLARIDAFLTDNGVIYINELNTMPGFTNSSLYPKLWRAAGTSYTQLIDKIIALALK